MAEKHIEILRTAREQMVHQRRKAAETLAKQPSSREAIQDMVAAQDAIDIIDRAIKDEDVGLEPDTIYGPNDN